MPRVCPDDVPVLTDGAVTLRAHAPADLDRIVEQSTDPVSLRFTTVPRPYTRQHAGQYLEHVRQRLRRRRHRVDALAGCRGQLALPPDRLAVRLPARGN